MILTKIAEIFDKPITETLVDAYADALEGYSKDQIAAAARQLMRTSEFFPRPANFIKLIDPPEDKIVTRRNDDAIAAAAWATFIKWLEGATLDKNDPARMAGEAIGGKVRFSSMPYDQIEYYRGDFKDAYLTILNEQERGEALKEIGAAERTSGIQMISHPGPTVKMLEGAKPITIDNGQPTSVISLGVGAYKNEYPRKLE